MIRNSNISKESSAYEIGRHQALRWRTVSIALVFALAIGSAGQTQPVQAAPAPEIVRWYMGVVDPKTTLCIGETVEYSVKVYFVNVVVPGPPRAREGILIDAFSSNRDVGDFRQDAVITGFTDIDLESADFSFTAREPGNTDLYFEGMLDRQDKSTYVDFIMPVKVILCKFKVIVASKWSASYPGLTATLVANLTGVMTADQQGILAGTTNVTWSMAAFSPMCSHRQTFSRGLAHLSGQLSNDGTRMTVSVIHDPVTANQVNCKSTVTTQVQGPYILTDVPVRGGTFTYPQSIRVGEMDFNGETTLTVTLLDGAQ